MFIRRMWPSRHGSGTLLDAGRLMRDFESLLDAAARSPLEDPSAGVFPAMNVTRNSDAFFVRAELPGVNAEGLKITAEGSKLTVAGSREIPAEQGNVSYHRRERAAGAFSRTVVLPHEVDGERVEAHYVNGVLTITLPIAEAARPRRITVQRD